MMHFVVSFCNRIISLLIVPDEAHVDYAAFVQFLFVKIVSTSPVALLVDFCFLYHGGVILFEDYLLLAIVG